jgi:hypothetical protein
MNVFAKMNRIQKILQIARPGDAEPVYSDVILKLVEHVGLEHMLPLNFVSVYWYACV